MTKRTITRWPDALRGIAVGLFCTHLASAQATAPDAGELGDCMPSREPHACAERCPSFDTCYIADDTHLYYRVMGERFDCEGLDCTAASTRLGDYCCERGEYAPSRGGGSGGCVLAPAAQKTRAQPPERPNMTGTCLAALGGLLIVRRGARARFGGLRGQAAPPGALRCPRRGARGGA